MFIFNLITIKKRARLNNRHKPLFYLFGNCKYSDGKE